LAVLASAEGISFAIEAGIFQAPASQTLSGGAIRAHVFFAERRVVAAIERWREVATASATSRVYGAALPKRRVFAGRARRNRIDTRCCLAPMQLMVLRLPI
jgi:hypothetical protein